VFDDNSAEAAAAGVFFRRLASTSDEQSWARTLASNMQHRQQTVIKVCGATAVVNAVMAVALARERLQRQWGQDLVLQPRWVMNPAYGREVGLQLVVMRCSREFPPKLLLEPLEAEPSSALEAS
jgi:stage V sporulation protein SpoVS